MWTLALSANLTCTTHYMATYVFGAIIYLLCDNEQSHDYIEFQAKYNTWCYIGCFKNLAEPTTNKCVIFIHKEN